MYGGGAHGLAGAENAEEGRRSDRTGVHRPLRPGAEVDESLPPVDHAHLSWMEGATEKKTEREGDRHAGRDVQERRNRGDLGRVGKREAERERDDETRQEMEREEVCGEGGSVRGVKSVWGGGISLSYFSFSLRRRCNENMFGWFLRSCPLV